MNDHNKPACDWVTKYRGWHLKGDSVFISCLTDKGWDAQLIIRVVSKNIWNYAFLPPDSGFLIPPNLIDENYCGPIPLIVEENATGLILKGINLKVLINRDPWNMIFLDENDHMVFRDICPDKELSIHPAMIPLGYFLDVNNNKYTMQSFVLRPDEHFFGFGEHSNIQFGVGQKIILWNEPVTLSDSVNSNKNIPFFFSTKGYGMFINSTSQIELEFGANYATSCSLLNKNKLLDVFIIQGNSPKEIIYQYCSLTGKAAIPPKWSFGICISVTDEYLSSNAIDNLINGFEKENIPKDVLLICPGSFTSKKYSAFMRNTDLKKLFSHIHRRGLKICLRVYPYVSIESELYHEAKLNNFLIKKINGEVYIISFLNSDKALEGIGSTFRCKDIRGSDAALIDFTNPAACDWYKEVYSSFFDAGADILSTEYGEEIPGDAVFLNGETGETIHNLYSLLFTRTVSEMTKKAKAYETTFSRSGSSGIQRFSICWSHNSGTEFEHLACAIKRAISSGLSGIPFWVIDIDNIADKISEELYIRWIQFQMFCSHSRIPGNILAGIHNHDEKTVLLLRRWIEMRYSIFPYLYSVSWESSLTGLPVIRSMYLSFPDDVNTADKDLQYMFGPSLLIAPVYNENSSLNIYLPEGEWISLYSNEKYEGNRNLSLVVPLDQIPIYIKSGSIIPMMQFAEHIPENFIDPLILSIYPDQKSRYTLYEDEGISEFNCVEKDGRIIIEIHGCRARSFNLRINGIKTVSSILLNSGNAQIKIKEYVFTDRFLEIKMPEVLIAQILIE